MRSRFPLFFLVVFFFEITLASAQSTLPTGWSQGDVGTVGASGNGSYATGSFTIAGSGTQIFGSADSFHFVYQLLSGNGTLVARLASAQGAPAGGTPYLGPYVGVMIRESLNANSTHAYTVYRPNFHIQTIWRTNTGGGTSSQDSSISNAAPYWLKIVRSGSTFSSYASPDGITWTQVGSSHTITMATNVYIGLAVSSSANTTLETATFNNVSVSSAASAAPVIGSIWPTTGLPGYDVLVSGSGFGTSQGNSLLLLNGTQLAINSWSAASISATIPPGTISGPLDVLVAPSMNSSNPAIFKVLPSPMLDQDVGTVGAPGTASYGNGVFSVSGAGTQIFGSADSFHFVYQQLSGNGTLVARLTSAQGIAGGGAPYVGPYLGVMIRESLNANSTHALTVFRPNYHIQTIWRASTGGSTSSQDSSISNPMPYWLKIVRSGTTFSSYASPDGVTWTQVGSNHTITMATNAYIGLAVSSSSNTTIETATFDNVSITVTAVQSPIISDINPFSGVVGSTLAIYGANFGTQGSNTVTLNGTACTPSVWTPTLIVVTVPAGATSGSVVVHTGGLTSNSVSFAVVSAPVITSLSTTSGPVGTSVTITGSNFGASQGSSTVKFNGTTAAPATSWGPTSIQVSVPSGATTGNVVVNVSGIPSNVAYFTVTSNSPSITNLTPASGPVGSTVTIAGTNFGSSPGYVNLNGKIAAISTWSATSIAATVPAGATTGPLVVVVNAGPASNPATFTVYTVQPGSPTLLVTPGKINMVVGQTQAVQLLDQNGVPIINPSWSIANPSVAAMVLPVNQGDPTLVQAVAVGNTTVTGTSADNRTGTAQVSILAGTSLPIGTVQWEVPGLNAAAGGIASIFQSLRVDDATPDFYAFDLGANGGNGAVRALTSDGQQKWIFSPNGEEKQFLAADDQGGFLYATDDPSTELETIARVDKNGNQTWAYPTNGVGTISNVAIHPDGTIYFVQPDYLNSGTSPSAVVALDGSTGQLKFAIPLPQTSYTGADYSFLNDPNGGNGGDGYPAIGGQYCTPGAAIAPSAGWGNPGNLTISSDGTVYLPIGGGTTFYDAMPCDPSPDPLHPGFPHLVKSNDGSYSLTSKLQVMAIHSDGTYSFRQLDSASSSGPPNNRGNGGIFLTNGGLAGATPDGNGGTLVATNFPNVQGVSSSFYHDTGSVVSKLNLSFNPTSEILTGEDGTAYLSGPNPSPATTGAIAAINTAANTTDWTDTLSTGSPQLVAAPAAGGVIFEDNAGHMSVTDPNGIISPLFPGSNGTDAGPVSTTSVNYWTLGTWFASLSDGGLAPITGNNTFLAASQRPFKGGSEKKDSKPRFPRVLAYVPSQVENTAPTEIGPCTSQLTTNSFPCFMDQQIANALTNYSQPNYLPPPQRGMVVEQSYRLRQKAIVQNFRNDLAKPLAAIAFIGHSQLVQGKNFSVGINFYYPNNPGKNPGDTDSWDLLAGYPGPGGLEPLTPECAAPDNSCQNPNPAPVNKLLPFEKDTHTKTGLSGAWDYDNDYVTTAVTPGPPHAPILLVGNDKIAPQARILFFGACSLKPSGAQPNEVPVFLQMWDVNDAQFGVSETRPRALVIPDGNGVDLRYASYMWEAILSDMLTNKVTIKKAVDDANASITPNWPITPGQPPVPPFIVYGNPNVKLLK
jgi:hypothetical protein